MIGNIETNEKGLHIGIILDGNRRYAKKLALQPWKGHDFGTETFEKLLDWCKELGIKELTLYCFSLENFKRQEKEVEYLMDIFKKQLRKFMKDKRLDEDKVKVRFIGKTEKFDKELQELMREIEKKTEKNNKSIINFCMAYGGRQEIIDTFKKIVENKIEINEENFQKNLWLSDEPDFIIRTGGVVRTSNFLPWQSTYSEWIFLDKMWPEFTKEDLISAIEEFKTRERRFGK